jgi:hypothetical protein
MLLAYVPEVLISKVSDERHSKMFQLFLRKIKNYISGYSAAALQSVATACWRLRNVCTGLPVAARIAPVPMLEYGQCCFKA